MFQLLKHQEKQEYLKLVLQDVVEEKENKQEDFFGDISKTKGGVKPSFFVL